VATDSLFSRTVRRICSWIVSRGADESRPVAVITPLITQPGEEPESPIPVFDLTSHVVDDDKVVRSDGSSGDPLHAARYEHGLWRIAWSDGRLGVDPDAQNELIRAQAAITRQTRIAGVRAKLEKAQAAENFRKEDYDRAHADWEKAKKEHDDVSAQQRRDPAGFSRWLTWIYFLFAAAILLADLPLSLLVAEGLGVQLQITDGNPHDLAVLLRNWSTSWEAIAVSIGVAALTIAFKLIIDRMHIRDDDSEHSSLRHFRSGIRLVTLLAATAATIYAFYVMGRVRAALSAGVSPEPLDKQYLFTALAILFPVVAAFCLSMGRLCWQNAKRLALAARERDKVWRRYRTAQEPFEEAQSARTAIQSRLDAMTDQQIDEMFLRELYTHAFDRGWAVPETRLASASLYDRCEHLMHRALARIEQLDNA
jgi:hypothetical protein